MKHITDSTVARIAGNIAAGVVDVSVLLDPSTHQGVARATVQLALAIVAEVDRQREGEK